MRRTLLALLLAAAPAAAQQTAAPTENAEYSRSTEQRGVVELVDLATRVVVLRSAEGRKYQVVAGPGVGNLADLAPGDRVVHRHFEAVAVAMAHGTERAGTERDRTVSESGAAVLTTVSSTLEFVSYDAAAETVTVLTPEGKTRILPVTPEIRDFVAARRPGDLVEATMTVADAFEIVEE